MLVHFYMEVLCLWHEAPLVVFVLVMFLIFICWRYQICHLDLVSLSGFKVIVIASAGNLAVPVIGAHL